MKKYVVSETSKYILFHCHHLSSLSQLITLKYLFHRNDLSILLVNHAVFGQTTFAKNLEKKKIFTRVLTIIEPKNFSAKQGEEFVSDHYDSYFEEMKLSFDNISEIYTVSDLNNLFPIYCRIHKIPITYVEMYPGQFEDESRYNASTEIFKYPGWLGELSLRYHSLTGDNSEYTKKRYLYYGSHIEYKNKDILIDFLNEFYSMDDKIKSSIIECIELPNDTDFSNFSIVLMNSSKWIHHISGIDLPYYYLLYQLIIDYYLSNESNVWIKNHPHSFSDKYYETHIKNKLNILPALVPIEFFGLYDKFHVNISVSINSSSAAKISRFTNSEIRLGNVFFDMYLHIHKINISLLLGRYLGVDSVYETVGIDISFLKLIMKNISQSLSNVQFCPTSIFLKCYIVYNSVFDFSNLSKYDNSLIFFINDDSFIKTVNNNPMLKKNSFRIKISKIALEDNSLSNMNNEYVYLICTNKMIENKIRLFKCEYILKNTGIIIKATCDNI